ncbi:MAG: hypothetical protein GY750_20895 [Lentisphaerae bacterium]|nr:hypothetical protein [Lentisphaerota bacterium]
MEKFTKIEKAVVKGFLNNDYTSDVFCATDANKESLKDCFDACPWVWSVLHKDYTGIDVKVARGGLGSLVKKGVFTVWDAEGYDRADDMAVSINDKELFIQIASEVLNIK